MAYLYTHNGKLLKVGNKLASSANCCCGECCTPTAPTLIFRSPDYPEDPETTYTQYWCGECCQGITFAFTYPGGGFSITMPWGAGEAGYSWTEGLTASGDVTITVSYTCVGNQLKLSISYYVYPTGNTHTYEATVPVSTTAPCCPQNGALTLTQTSTPVVGESLDSVTIGAAGAGLFHDDGGGHVDTAELRCGDDCDIGACCLAGNCTIKTAADCTASGSADFTPNTPCSSEYCWYACCSNDNVSTYENLGCTNQPTQSACEGQDTMGGNIVYIWSEGVKCESGSVSPCLGMCCFDGDCLNYTEAQCNNEGGYWYEHYGFMCAGNPTGVPCICQSDSECPEGMCCVPYEPGDPDPYGQCAPCAPGDPGGCPEGYTASGGDCIEDTGACCYYESSTMTCGIRTYLQCDAVDGVWQGAGTTCAGGDCDDTCCITITDDSCSVTRCEAGYFAGHPDCVGGAGCDDTAPRGNAATGSVTAVIYCKEGTELETTATFSGAVFNTGDTDYDAFLSGIMNTGYSVTRTGCTGDAGGPSGTLFPDVGSYDVYGEGPLSHDVRVHFPTYHIKTTRIAILLGASTIYFMEFAAARSRPVGPCDDPYDCADRFTAHGPPTSKGGAFDCPTCFVVTGATVTCS